MIGTYLQKTNSFFRKSPLDRTEMEKWCLNNKTSMSVAMACFTMCEYNERAAVELLNNSDTSLTTIILERAMKNAPTVYDNELYFNGMLFSFSEVERLKRNKE